MRRPLDPCPACGVTVVWAKINIAGDLCAFERSDSPALRRAIDTDDAVLREYLRWALAPGTPGHFATVRDLTAARVPLGYGEGNALPHDVICTRRRVEARRRHHTPAYAR